MSANKYCLACSEPVKFQCTCCHTAGYCSEKCQKRDWPLLHRHEQIALTAALHQSLSLDASHRTKERQQRHRDVFTRRVNPVQRGKRAAGDKSGRHNRGFTKEEIEAELRRQARKGGQEQVEEMVEEVVRNSMPPALQRFVDARRLVSEERDETVAALHETVRLMWGEVAVAGGPVLEPDRTFFRDPADIQREVEVTFLGQLEELRGRMRELGEEREITPQHQTAIAHYLRMAELAQLKYGLAALSRSVPHSRAAQRYHLELDEFNQRLTHSIFFEGTPGVEYEQVVRQMDEATVGEFARHEAAYLYQGAMAATLDALASGQPLRFSMFTEIADEDEGAQATFATNMRRLFDAFDENYLQNRVGYFIKGLWAFLVGVNNAEYEANFRAGAADRRYTDNSKQLVADVADAFVEAVEVDEADDQAGLKQRLQEDGRWSVRRGLQVLYNQLPPWKEVLVTFVSSLAITTLMYAGGLAFLASESVQGNLEAMVNRLFGMQTTVETLHSRTLSDVEATTALKQRVDELMKQQNPDYVVLHELDRTTVAATDLVKEDLPIRMQLNLYGENVLTALNVLEQDIGDNAAMSSAFEQLRSMILRYPDVAYEQKADLLGTIVVQMKAMTDIVTDSGAAVTIGDYKKLLQEVETFVSRVMQSNDNLLKSLDYMKQQCAGMGMELLDAQEKLKRTEIKAPFMNRIFGGLAFDTSRLFGVASAQAVVFSLALTGLGVSNAFLWLHQCEERLHALLLAWGPIMDSNGVTHARNWWDAAWSMAQSLFDPRCSTFVTIFYFTNACYSLLSAGERILTWGQRVASWIPGSKWLYNRFIVPEPDDEALSDFQNAELRESARKAIERHFQRLGPNAAAILREIKEAVDSKLYVTPQKYGLMMAYLQEEILKRQLDLGILPPLPVLEPGAEPARRFTLNAYTYTATYLAEEQARNSATFTERVARSIPQALRDLYKWSARYTLLYQGWQLWQFAGGIYRHIISFSTTISGLGAFAAVGCVMYMAAPPESVRAAREARDLLGQGKYLRALIPVGGALLHAAMAGQFYLTATIYTCKSVALLWDSVTWLINLPGYITLPTTHGLLTGGLRWLNPSTGVLLGWDNTVAMREEAKQDATRVLEESRELQLRHKQVTGLATRHNAFTTAMLNVSAVGGNGTSSGALVARYDTLQQTLRAYDERSKDLYEETLRFYEQTFLANDLNIAASQDL